MSLFEFALLIQGIFVIGMLKKIAYNLDLMLEEQQHANDQKTNVA